MARIISNKKIIELAMKKSGCKNPNQLANYLTEKYGVKIARQQIDQFQKSERVTITHLLMRELIE